MRGGRSLDNLHRVSFGDGGGAGPENQPSLGEPGTFVSRNYVWGLAKGSGIILYWVWYANVKGCFNNFSSLLLLCCCY